MKIEIATVLETLLIRELRFTMSAVIPSLADSRWWRVNVAGVLGALSAYTISFMATAVHKGELHFNLVMTEKGRESGGLLILLVWLSLLLCSSYRKLQ